ncbi:GGDEF domain-containing protein [Acidithrix sp. C25]|uniref:GGDEF domain-containing protein n=1 Tax=Acidithrix sp. C25 TaxID=1671482 RepID=UPI00191BB064|nr:GGDEF domain-containing protein [Acidithrix sp. C25]CAG4914490.1 unnamed protein product [Acidithrix sp. C25]
MKLTRNIGLLSKMDLPTRERAGIFGALQLIALNLIGLCLLPSVDYFGANEPFSLIILLVGLFVGSIFLGLPWRKLDQRVNLLISIAAFIEIGLLGPLFRGGFFVLPPLILMIYVYIGLMQDPRLIVVNAAIAFFASIPLLSGLQVQRWLAVGVISQLVGLEVALSLVLLRSHEIQKKRINDWLLSGFSDVAKTGRTIDTMTYVAKHIDGLLSTFGVVLAIWQKGSRFGSIQFATSFPERETSKSVTSNLVSSDGRSGFIEASRSKETIFVPNTALSDLDRSAVEIFGYSSALFMPLATETVLSGAVGIYWKRSAPKPEADLIAAISSFLGEAARVIATQYENEELATKIRFDELTALYSRRAFFGELNNLGDNDSLAFFDLDHFKVLNDTLGHAQGDLELYEFGRILLGEVRNEDLPCRYGGEEFVVILRNCDESDARLFVDRVRISWKAVGRVTFSAGIACMQPGAAPPSVLLAADRAMYGAKSRGRNATVVGSISAIDQTGSIPSEISFRV